MAYLPYKKSLLVVSLLVGSSLASFGSNDAVAGFQWTAPAGVVERSQQMPSVPAPRVQRVPQGSLPTPSVAPMQIPQSIQRQAQPQMQPQTMPTTVPNQASVAQAAPQIIFEPMDAPRPAPLSAPTPNVMPLPTPTPMASPAPVQAVPPSAPQSAPQSTPQAITSRTVASMPVQSGVVGNTPRRIRPQMQPQSIAPSAMPQGMIGSSVAPKAASTSYGGTVDFVPTHSGTVGNAMTATKMFRSSPDSMATASATGPAMASVVPPSYSANMPVAGVRDTGPVKPFANSYPAPLNAAPPQRSDVAGYNSAAVSSVPLAPMGAQMGVPAFSGQPMSFENAVGFGKDLPLMTAVKQIVPKSYGLSFASGVPTNINISWDGGRPWNEVLDLALAPHNLQSVVSEGVVTIVPFGGRVIPSSFSVGDSGNRAMNAPMTMQDVQKTVMMEPILDDTMTPQSSGSFNYNGERPVPLLQPAMATSDMSIGGGNQNYIQQAAGVGPYTGQSTQPMIGSMQGTMGQPPVDSMNPQLYDNSVQYWAAPKESTLRDVLTSWTRKAGVELFWSSEYDYPISTAVNIEGGFETAVQTLLKGLEESDPRPLGRLHPNLPNGPAVLVIETRRLTD